MKISSRIIIILIAIFLSNIANATTPKVQEFVSKNGIKYWHIEDNYLPIISLRMVFTKSGSAYDPENKQGLASIASDLLVEGAGGISGIDFMKQLEGLATSISFSVDADNFYVSLTCLKENLDESMRLLAIALNSPDFTPDAIERVRKVVLTNITRREENPAAKAQEIFQENFFAGHPYSRPIEGTKDGVNSIDKTDLVNFTKAHFSRSNMLIGLTGSSDAKQIGQLLDKYLAKLPANTGKISQLAEFIPGKNLGKVIKIEQDVPQSVIIFGFPGPKRNDSDFYDSYVMNYVVGGGGFESRLMNEVREKRGLAYTAYTSLQTYEKAGLISGYVATKNASVDESLKVISAEIEKMHAKGIEQQELDDSAKYLIGSFPLRMTRNSSLASFITAMQYDKLGVDFLEKRNGYINAVDLPQANKAAAKYFDPAKMLVVVVGKTK